MEQFVIVSSSSSSNSSSNNNNNALAFLGQSKQRTSTSLAGGLLESADSGTPHRTESTTVDCCGGDDNDLHSAFDDNGGNNNNNNGGGGADLPQDPEQLSPLLFGSNRRDGGGNQRLLKKAKKNATTTLAKNKTSKSSLLLADDDEQTHETVPDFYTFVTTTTTTTAGEEPVAAGKKKLPQFRIQIASAGLKQPQQRQEKQSSLLQQQRFGGGEFLSLLPIALFDDVFACLPWSSQRVIPLVCKAMATRYSLRDGNADPALIACYCRSFMAEQIQRRRFADIDYTPTKPSLRPYYCFQVEPIVDPLLRERDKPRLAVEVDAASAATTRSLDYIVCSDVSQTPPPPPPPPLQKSSSHEQPEEQAQQRGNGDRKGKGWCVPLPSATGMIPTIVAPSIRVCRAGISGLPDASESRSSHLPWARAADTASFDWVRVKTKNWEIKHPFSRVLAIHAQRHLDCCHAAHVRAWCDRVHKSPAGKKRKLWEPYADEYHAPVLANFSTDNAAGAANNDCVSMMK